MAAAMDGASRDFLFIQSTTEVGGAETVLLNLFEANEDLRRRGLVASLSFGAGDLPVRLRALGVEVVEIPRARLRQPWGVVQTLRMLARLARSRGVKVIVGNGSHPQILGGLTARLTGARSVFLVHMIHEPPLWKNDPRDALALRGPCDLMLAVSKAAQASLIKLRPSVESRLFYAGTPQRTVAPADVAQARAELGAEADDVVFGVFGRLQRWKGQDVFVAASADVARRRPHARFVVVGGSVFGLEPEFFEQLKGDAARFGLTDRMRFTGFRSDVARLMSACDVVCHTTRVPEPFGMVVLEAMALGRPVIATRGGGPSEVITSEDLGILIPPDDAPALAAAMTRLIDEPERRRLMGARAAERARRDFSVTDSARALVGYLDGTLERPHKTKP
jgi:glycosyltransferase involved in cell wall biosynthesis